MSMNNRKITIVTFTRDYSDHVDYILVINFEFLEKNNLWETDI